MQKTYKDIESIAGPILVVDGVEGVKYEELVEVETSTGERRMGKVLEAHETRAMVQMFESTQGLSTSGLKAKFLGKTARLGVSTDMLGRIFNGAGKPIDKGPEILAEKKVKKPDNLAHICHVEEDEQEAGKTYQILGQPSAGQGRKLPSGYPRTGRRGRPNRPANRYQGRTQERNMQSCCP